MEGESNKAIKEDNNMQYVDITTFPIRINPKKKNKRSQMYLLQTKDVCLFD